MILFNRVYQLDVGGQIKPLNDPITGQPGIGPVNSEVRRWTDLRITFSATKTMDESANTGKIEIYNLSKKSQEFLKSSVNRKVILGVGYGGASQLFGTLIQGDIMDVKVSRTRPEVVTTIEYGEGEVALNQAINSKTYKQGTPIKTIVLEKISELKASAGPALKGFIDSTITEALGSDLNANGRVKDFLSLILGKMGLSYSIQNDEFTINEFANQTDIYRLDFESGLLKQPEDGEDGKLKIQCLLNPKILPGKVVQVVTKSLNGYFQVESGTYSGDSFDGDWTIDAQVRAA